MKDNENEGVFREKSIQIEKSNIPLLKYIHFLATCNFDRGTHSSNINGTWTANWVFYTVIFQLHFMKLRLALE